MKNKFAWSKEGKMHSNRYNTQSSHQESTPALTLSLQAREIEKENNQNVNNYLHAKNSEEKYGLFDPVKSMEVPKRLRTSANDLDFGQFRKTKTNNHQGELQSSQEFFRFRQKQITEPHEEGHFPVQQLTFGEVNRNGIVTSRQFLEEKRVKNEVIDEIMANAKRGLCKSFNQFTLGGFTCVNHPNKKAKYRLIAELSEGEEEMFYCSKCAINLLQQNFKIQEIKPEESSNQSSSKRVQEITKFELRLRNLEERARMETEKNYIKDDLDQIEEQIMNSSNKFDCMMEVMKKIKNQWLCKLNSLRLKKQSQEKERKDSTFDMLAHMRDIQLEIKEYKNTKKFAVMKENEFQFITASLNNKIGKFEEKIAKTKIPSPCHTFITQNFNETHILDKVKEEILQAKQKVKDRRQREITFSRKSEANNKNSEDEFTCDELKRPFRVLFPSEELEHSQSVELGLEKSSMLSSVRERSAFQRLT